MKKINNNGENITYTYDKKGNIKTITEPRGQILYYYNELNELIQEDNQILNKTIIYYYDKGGNLTRKQEIAYGSGTKTNYYYEYNNSNWKDKLTSYDGKAITYDAIGNPLTYDGWTFDWEKGRQLKSLNGNGYNIDYKYNSSGIRTEKTVNGITTKYHIVGNKVTYETNGTDNIYYTYSSSSNLVSMNLNGDEYYYIRNVQGDIIGLFDKDGTEVVKYTYDSWGKLISIEGTLASTVGVKNPYRYRGYRYDTETGLYYLQSRYYSPKWGRFINADGIAGSTGDLLSHNMFAYCMNNPVNMKDPSGFRPIFTLGEETKAMVEASFDIMNGATLTEISNNYESKGNIKTSTIYATAASIADNATATIAKKFIKDTTRKTIYGLFGAVWRNTSVTFHGVAPLVRSAIGIIGTAGFFIYNSISVLNKYGWSWQGGGKRVFVDFITTGVAVGLGMLLIPASAGVFATIGIGTAIGLGVEMVSRTYKWYKFKDSFWG
ncbi:tRNA nuclease WapA precursor [Clostridium tepidiprofundi DSM 19306]|uniref:tRNA nuclease WapA n=1 Tax=Clostridium tepidiprofundi DSM 19306 TaxID=1121338 RepID=A0A151AS75_9CLOT|nr:RHS repeat-associated core domain-containing protein [Clostridium tepidiprofundi]KYH30465.1 tRNA nuclease WapA precursor [Clostridium tepidiprofundi DSM 19306]